eukprot:Opistho-2@43006
MGRDKRGRPTAAPASDGDGGGGAAQGSAGQQQLAAILRRRSVEVGMGASAGAREGAHPLASQSSQAQLGLPPLPARSSSGSLQGNAAAAGAGRLAIPHSYTVLATPNAYRDLGRSDMRRILRMVTFLDDYATMTKAQRLEILREEDTPENAEKRRTVAAIEIQRRWRGFWTRAMLHDLTDGHSSIFPLHTRSRFADSEQGLRDVKTPPLICREYLEAKYEDYLQRGKEIIRKSIFSPSFHF